MIISITATHATSCRTVTTDYMEMFPYNLPDNHPVDVKITSYDPPFRTAPFIFVNIQRYNRSYGVPSSLSRA
jgi:hypothetical protein